MLSNREKSKRMDQVGRLQPVIGIGIQVPISVELWFQNQNSAVINTQPNRENKSADVGQTNRTVHMV